MQMGCILRFSHDGLPPPLSQGSRANEADSTRNSSSNTGATKGDQECGPGEMEGEGEWERGDWEGGGGNLMSFIKAKPARNQSSSKVEGQDEQNKDWDLKSEK